MVESETAGKGGPTVLRSHGIIYLRETEMLSKCLMNIH